MAEQEEEEEEEEEIRCKAVTGIHNTHQTVIRNDLSEGNADSSSHVPHHSQQADSHMLRFILKRGRDPAPVHSLIIYQVRKHSYKYLV